MLAFKITPQNMDQTIIFAAYWKVGRSVMNAIYKAITCTVLHIHIGWCQRALDLSLTLAMSKRASHHKTSACTVPFIHWQVASSNSICTRRRSDRAIFVLLSFMCCTCVHKWPLTSIEAGRRCDARQDASRSWLTNIVYTLFCAYFSRWSSSFEFIVSLSRTLNASMGRNLDCCGESV